MGNREDKESLHKAGDTASEVDKNADVVKAAMRFYCRTFPKSPSKMEQKKGSTIKDAIARVQSLVGKEELMTDEKSEWVATLKVLIRNNYTTWHSRTKRIR